jgi:hypothetical protein
MQHASQQKSFLQMTLTAPSRGLLTNGSAAGVGNALPVLCVALLPATTTCGLTRINNKACF